jgi:hypothetical protein
MAFVLRARLKSCKLLPVGHLCMQHLLKTYRHLSSLWMPVRYMQQSTMRLVKVCNESHQGQFEHRISIATYKMDISRHVDMDKFSFFVMCQKIICTFHLHPMYVCNHRLQIFVFLFQVIYPKIQSPCIFGLWYIETFYVCIISYIITRMVIFSANFCFIHIGQFWWDDPKYKLSPCILLVLEKLV